MKYLMYHSFCKDLSVVDRHHISEDSFAKQVKDALTIGDLTITIDDGVKSVFDIAMPILEETNISTIIFIITSGLDKDLMTSEQIKELSNSGVSIQSHSHSHRNHTLLSTEQIIDEGKRSKDILEQLTNKEITKYSFPGGYYNENICEILNKVGYNEFFTSEYGYNTKLINGYTIRDRIEIYGEEDIGFYISKKNIFLRKLRSEFIKVINYFRKPSPINFDNRKI